MIFFFIVFPWIGLVTTALPSCRSSHWVASSAESFRQTRLWLLTERICLRIVKWKYSDIIKKDGSNREVADENVTERKGNNLDW